ncbi:MAG TPA: DUF3014 domain-containing protein [Anaeromyxobacteraceae bacterium]|nr:DUF3014 domain-containing protein [Anaeromyxobacteraceae bacterium]
MSLPQPQEPPEQSDYEPSSTLRRPSRLPWILLALALVAAAVAAVLWYRQRTPAGPTPPAAAPPAEAQKPEAPPGPAPATDAARARSLVEALSPDPRFRRWLPEGDLVRRWAVVTDNLAEGVSPRRQLGFLAPARPFSVVSRGGKEVMAQDSYRRYDELADVVASVDALAVAKAYRELHSILEAAYRALGYPNASLDGVTSRALRRIEAAPVQDGEVAVLGVVGLYEFADPRLEKLGAVEKHLLRMGPRNMRLIQAKAREIREALGLQTAPQAPTGAPK